MIVYTLSIGYTANANFKIPPFRAWS